MKGKYHVETGCGEAILMDERNNVVMKVTPGTVDGVSHVLIERPGTNECYLCENLEKANRITREIISEYEKAG